MAGVPIGNIVLENRIMDCLRHNGLTSFSASLQYLPSNEGRRSLTWFQYFYLFSDQSRRNCMEQVCKSKLCQLFLDFHSSIFWTRVLGHYYDCLQFYILHLHTATFDLLGNFFVFLRCPIFLANLLSNFFPSKFKIPRQVITGDQAGCHIRYSCWE